MIDPPFRFGRCQVDLAGRCLRVDGARLAQIDASLAGLPVVLAPRARMLRAAGDASAARQTQRRALAAHNAPAGNDDLTRLGAVCAAEAHDTMAPAALPRAPTLPSRL